MDSAGHVDEALRKRLARLNLRRNPFGVFELFEPGLDEDAIRKHQAFFQDRDEIFRKILYGIVISQGYRVVIHGQPGVGKSSLLNKLLHYLNQEGFFTVKFRVPISIRGDRDFEREFIRNLGIAIASEASHNGRFQERVKSLFKGEPAKDVEEIALLTILYASEQATITNDRLEAKSLSTTLGIPILTATITKEQQEQLEVARIETLTHSIFADLVRRGIALLKGLGYKGVVLGLDEVDKLEDRQLEKVIVGLLKDVFYTYSGLAHVILVMGERNGLKPIHPDVFTYEPVLPPSQNNILRLIEELYKDSAVDPGVPMEKVIDRKLVLEVYENREGRIREILEDLSNYLLLALQQEDVNRMGLELKQKYVSVPVQGYLQSLQPEDSESKIIAYVLENKETHVRDDRLSKSTGLKKSALGRHLETLRERSVLAINKRGRKKVYYLDPGVVDAVRKKFR